MEKCDFDIIVSDNEDSDYESANNSSVDPDLNLSSNSEDSNADGLNGVKEYCPHGSSRDEYYLALPPAMTEVTVLKHYTLELCKHQE